MFNRSPSNKIAMEVDLRMSHRKAQSERDNSVGGEEAQDDPFHNEHKRESETYCDTMAIEDVRCMRNLLLCRAVS
jgi:hypothetical protein